MYKLLIYKLYYIMLANFKDIKQEFHSKGMRSTIHDNSFDLDICILH